MNRKKINASMEKYRSGKIKKEFYATTRENNNFENKITKEKINFND